MSARPKKPRNARERAQRIRANKALAIQRKSLGMSWTRATRAAGTTPATANRYIGESVSKRDRRYKISASDRRIRRKPIATNTGEVWIEVRGSRQAEQIDDYWRALRRFRNGDADALRPFEGKSVGGYEFLSDPIEVEEMMDRGEVEIPTKWSE